MSRLPCLLSAALFALPALPAAAQDSAAADWRVEAFRSTCLPHRQDFGALTAHAVAEGWAEDAGTGHPEFAETLEIATPLPDEIEPGMQFTLKSYGRSIDGRFAGLILTYAQSEEIDLVGCYFYDFDAAAPVPQALMDAWLGKPPYEVLGDGQPMIGQQWSAPESLPGTWDVQNAYVPEGSPFAALTGFTGVLLRITAVDPKDG